MKERLTYSNLQLKRCLSVLARSTGNLLLVLCVTVAATVAVSYLLFQSKAFSMIHVAVVIPEDEYQSEAKLISTYISNMESVKAICDFEYMSAEEALHGLEQDELQAAIVLPASFYEDVYSQGEGVISVYFPKGKALNTEVFRELFSSGVKMIQTAEAGIFSAREVSKLYGSSLRKYQVGQLVSELYVEEALHRGDLFSGTILSPLGELQFFEFYYGTGFVIFLMMLGLTFGFLYQKESKSVDDILWIRGVRGGTQTIAKVCGMTVGLYLISLLIYLLSVIITGYFDAVRLDFQLSVCVLLFLLCLGISIYFHVIYSLAGNGTQGSAILLVLNIWMLLCSGTIIPSAYLPAVMRGIGRWMPISFFVEFATGIFFDNWSMIQVVLMFVWVLAAGSLGVFLIWRRRGISFN